MSAVASVIDSNDEEEIDRRSSPKAFPIPSARSIASASPAACCGARRRRGTATDMIERLKISVFGLGS